MDVCQGKGGKKMRPELKFEPRVMKVSTIGEAAGVPDLIGGKILQNDLEFFVDEDDELYEAYGTRRNSYPYRQYNSYTREFTEREVRTAVLENERLRAVFLPEYGGRLWELTDKVLGRNLLYTNDVLRFSNLAIRNAWFSGGVEWNVGIIGHTPFTADPLYTAALENEEGNPVLRMYEYERLRRVEYQMDFWLGERDRYLNCRMRIANSGREVVPMYWWSNMAVPEYPSGRIVVPASEAYTGAGEKVFKVDIPEVDGVDITRYGNIPAQVDYFFNIPREKPKYIANIDSEGNGLVQFSTWRLQGRKLFSWGHKKGGIKWQEFLTENAGNYVEIQAGLGKTQYGCIPMPPHSAWEWMEQYGAISLEKADTQLPFEQLRDKVTEYVSGELENTGLEKKLTSSKDTAVKKAELIYEGSGYGALENARRALTGERPLSEHLEYRFTEEGEKQWADFLRTEIFFTRDPKERPDGFMCDRAYYERLKETAETKNAKNWYARYQLGVMHIYNGANKKGRKELKRSWELAENCWACHGLGCAYIKEGGYDKAIKWLERGIRLRMDDTAYVKEGMRLLLMAGGYEKVEELYGLLPERLREESRIIYDYLTALAHTGKQKEAYDYLSGHPGYVLEDLRECESSVSDLWREVYQSVKGSAAAEIPGQWDFGSL